VESVAWIAERKDVLSGMFWMLTMIAYGCYARRPAFGRYLALLLSFALGLAAKSMLVTLPCVLLLLDVWPLRRWRPQAAKSGRRARDRQGRCVAFPPAKSSSFRGAKDDAVDDRDAEPFAIATPAELFLEKGPLFTLSALASWLTFIAQRDSAAWGNIAVTPMGLRCENALTSYVAYLGKMCWPAKLAILYPYPLHGLPAWQTAAAAALLLAISVAAVLAVRRRPHLLIGWLWYLGTLVPVIGIVQVGQQAMADRYTYLPLIGVWIAMVWQADVIIRRWPRSKAIAAALATACLTACAVQSREQLSVWTNDRTLWEHALAATQNNYFAEHMLAQLCLDAGETEAAERHARRAIEGQPTSHALLVLGILELRRNHLPEAESCCLAALRLFPEFPEAHHTLGQTYVQSGRLDDAFKCFANATRLRPWYLTAYEAAGRVLLKQRKFAEAARWFSSCLECDPNYAQAYAFRGDALFYQQQWRAAVEDYRRAAELEPHTASHCFNLAAALEETNASAEARRQYRQGLKLEPDWPERAAEQAWQAATAPGTEAPLPEKALKLARQACQATEPNTPPKYLDVLAAAYANAGQFEQAAATVRLAIKVLADSEDRERAEQYRQRLACYQNRRPFRQLETASSAAATSAP
jgi:tetratricopeptide (TPR) repeat protein